ncbi:MAG: aminotransferase class I/II-fold pyridoxal phosphate-dependent enzyme, partial [Spirochaetales bacterium]|nr:aminotransferase class I/II-fold pyridoxal phosphate-dependent enzyme [Spirochaetales bacterium]
MELSQRLAKLGTENAFAVSAAAAAWAAAGHKVYAFHLGDLNLPTSPAVVEAMNKAIRDGYTGYCPGAGIAELRAAVARDAGSARGVSYELPNVSIQSGGKPVIGKFISTVMDPGDEVLYPNPGFPIYESQIEFQGGVAVPYGFVETDDGFALDLDSLKRLINRKTKALIYNNYHNPSSAESSSQEMAELARLAVEHDLWVLSDDAYFDVRYAGEPLSIVSYPGMYERTVILYTFSKRFAMTGWRLGAAIGPEEVIDIINTLNTNDESCTTHFIQKALADTMEKDTSGPAAILQALKERRDAAVAGMNAIDGISVPTPRS